MSDYVDEVIASWQGVRPDLDTSSLAIAMRIERAAELVRVQLDAAVADHGVLSHKRDLDTLTALRRAGRGASLKASTLAAAGQLTSGGMTNRLDRLEAAGLIERSPDPDDRRGVRVALTDAGEALVDEVVVASLEAQDRLLATLSAADRQRLAAGLRNLLQDLGDRPIGLGNGQ